MNEINELRFNLENLYYFLRGYTTVTTYDGGSQIIFICQKSLKAPFMVVTERTVSSSKPTVFQRVTYTQVHGL